MNDSCGLASTKWQVASISNDLSITAFVARRVSLTTGEILKHVPRVVLRPTILKR